MTQGNRFSDLDALRGFALSGVLFSNFNDQINTNHIKKYGQKEYNSLIKRYLYDDITKKEVLSKLNSVKNVNIKIKPYFGKGADHVLI